MTGFIRGLFGGNKQSGESGAYFLSEDDAKTFGDIDYMRSNKVVKRTFARKKGQTEELESVRQISATSKQEVNEYGLPSQPAPQKTTTFQSSSFGQTSSASTPKFQQKKAPDNNMDMFRDMAKDIRKKR
ncbi:MAG: hypothetical protein AAFY20_12290 [Cyanobacteria bacterium J06639_14]